MNDHTQRIIQIMQDKKMSATQFSNAIGIQRAKMSHITLGRNNPTADVITKIIERFEDINPGWLLTGKGAMKSVPKQPENITEYGAMKSVPKQPEIFADYGAMQSVPKQPEIFTDYGAMKSVPKQPEGITDYGAMKSVPKQPENFADYGAMKSMPKQPEGITDYGAMKSVPKQPKSPIADNASDHVMKSQTYLESNVPTLKPQVNSSVEGLIHANPLQDYNGPSEDVNQEGRSVKITEKEIVTYKKESLKKIDKLVIFFSDKTFETFIPES